MEFVLSSLISQLLSRSLVAVFVCWLISHHIVSLVAGERDLFVLHSAHIGTAVQTRGGAVR